MKTKAQEKKAKPKDIGFRVYADDLDLISQAAEIVARKRGVFLSRHNFCVEAVIAEARRVITQSYHSPQG